MPAHTFTYFEINQKSSGNPHPRRSFLGPSFHTRRRRRYCDGIELNLEAEMSFVGLLFGSSIERNELNFIYKSCIHFAYNETGKFIFSFSWCIERSSRDYFPFFISQFSMAFAIVGPNTREKARRGFRGAPITGRLVDADQRNEYSRRDSTR